LCQACGLRLAVSRPMLAPCSGNPEAWSLKLVAIDQDPRAMLRPAVGHDLQVQSNRRQLSRRRVAYFYCEFFHLSHPSGACSLRLCFPNVFFLLISFCNASIDVWSLVLIQAGLIGMSPSIRYLILYSNSINLIAPYILLQSTDGRN